MTYDRTKIPPKKEVATRMPIGNPATIFPAEVSGTIVVVGWRNMILLGFLAYVQPCFKSKTNETSSSENLELQFLHRMQIPSYPQTNGSPQNFSHCLT